MALSGDDRPAPVTPVHVWLVDLSRLDIQGLWSVLAPDERDRAERFHFARDRDRYIAARGALRTLLSAHGAGPPERLRFIYGPQGKPALAGESPALRFNLAHSDDLALIAVAQRRDVGVDLEREQPDQVVTEVAPRVFCERERDGLARLEGASRQRTFVRMWTRKEAYIKADGGGFSLPLDRIDVSGRGRRVLVRDESGRWAASRRWSVYSVRVRPGYAGAIAVPCEPVRLIRRTWQAGEPPATTSGLPGDHAP